MEPMSVLLVISSVFAVLAGLVHVYIFFLESVAWTSPRVRKIFGIASDSEARATRSLAFNQGFYNLFLAIGAVLGVVLAVTGSGATGWTLVVFATASMLGAAVVLAGTGRRYLNSAFIQGSFPLIALLFAFLGSTFGL
jgi:putative membrane protein